VLSFTVLYFVSIAFRNRDEYSRDRMRKIRADIEAQITQKSTRKMYKEFQIYS